MTWGLSVWDSTCEEGEEEDEKEEDGEDDEVADEEEDTLIVGPDADCPEWRAEYPMSIRLRRL